VLFPVTIADPLPAIARPASSAVALPFAASTTAGEVATTPAIARGESAVAAIASGDVVEIEPTAPDAAAPAVANDSGA
jgi:hypothetical protein